MKTNIRVKKILSLFFLCSFSFNYQGHAETNAKKRVLAKSNNKLEFSKAPKPMAWKAFMQRPTAEILKEMQNLGALSKGNMNVKLLSWEWRIGLIRKCQKTNEPYCRKILVKAFNDPALVVRNEAVNSFAKRYQGTKNAEALAILEHVFKDPRNQRAGEPMFVQRKILFAIHEIGGVQAKALGHRLSKGSKQLKAYWAKL